MDSGNSGSIQSSSGGDEEYDSSRADSLSAFAHLSNPPPPSQPHHHHNSTLFDPLPNYFDPNPLPNFDPIWSKSPINCTYNSLPLPSSSGAALFTSSSSSPTVPFDPPKTDLVQPHLARNPKKRSRASRRAPTTVLTTDTTNFRAMVQEFTGIPAPPFTSSSSPFVRNRLDLFGAPSSTRSYPLSDALQPPPYLLRPFAQKFQPPPPPSSFLSPNSNDVASGNSTGSHSNSVNYQMQNQILTFQSLLQSPMANPSVLRSSGQDLLEIPSGNSDDVNPTVWGGGVGLNGGDQSHHLRTINGSYVDYSQSGGGGKGNYEKGSENVGAGRGGGMVESWICSSDH
ncbi:hypothetical protein RHGRI_022374 [Rhododendron griersonianum]|uniref:VQ domain-containing protein n=2 Tax=Rhododendron TaxID=4346 RepID=A0AAV6IZD4_9ERIC